LPFLSHAADAKLVCFISSSAPPLLSAAHSIGHSESPVQSFPRRSSILWRNYVSVVGRREFAVGRVG
jgi:hypothetical protein